jgi:SRSO17 transposase
MLPAGTVPVGLLQVLAGCRVVFTAPTFATFVLLVTGSLGAGGPGSRRTVTGMWAAAGMAGRSHWSRAHRFFSHARWDSDALGLALARVVVAAFAADADAVSVAVDDTLFHRYGRKVFGVFWQHDGSAKGRDGIGRGNCFVIAGLVTAVPFTNRKVFLPLLFRLHQPRTSASKPEQARELVDLLSAAFGHRRVHVVADAAYRSPTWRALPESVTFTTRLASNAVLYSPRPPRTGRRGRPALKGARLGTPADLAAAAPWQRLSVTRYAHTDTVEVAVITCLWWGSLRSTPVRVVLVRDSDSATAYDIALVTTDTTADPATIITRYADRWSIEQAIKDGKDLLGAGQAQNRLPAAVERTVPFTMLTLTILTCWYHHAGHTAQDLTARLAGAPWYRHKRHIAVTDMLIAFRRTRITAITAGQTTPQLNDHDAHTGRPSAA